MYDDDDDAADDDDDDGIDDYDINEDYDYSSILSI